MRVITVSFGIMILLACITIFCSCSKPGETGSAPGDEGTGQYLDFTRKFAEALIKEDFAAAYGMTSAKYKAEVSLEELKSQYTGFLSQIRKLDPEFKKPTMVETDSGEMPTSEEEARDAYDITIEYPRSSWRAWTFAELLNEEAVGFEARLFIVDEGGKSAVGFIEFGVIDD